MADPKAPPVPASTSNANANQKRTLVEDGTKFKGSLSSTCPVVVHGALEGDIESPAVTVSATGSVSGMVVSSTLQSAGKIAGDFDVESATVAGSVAKDTVVRAANMDFKLEASPDKKLELRFGPAPSNGNKGH